MTNLEKVPEPEPPSSGDAGTDTAERVIAASHVPPAAHVAVIGHHTA